jgi:8-oxo-dGTP pyrophosphatase MutT (NUDIX family)
MTPPQPVTLDHVRQALRQPLPGLPAQMRMSPRPRPGSERILDPDLVCRHAGVLVLLYPHNARDEDLWLVLTLRSESVAHHRGQISLPGGSQEPGETAMDAALRETWEELEVDLGMVEVLGELSPVYIPRSGFCVHPTVAHAWRRPRFVAFPGEVAEVIEAPVSLLLTPATRQEEMWQLHDEPVRVPFYAIGAHKVWGATAMILAELMAVLEMRI